MSELGEDLLGVTTFTKHMVDVAKVFEVPMREALLVWNDEVAFRRSKPAGEDAFKEDIGSEFWFAGEEPVDWRNTPTMADCDFETSRTKRGVDKIHVTVETYTIGAGNDVNVLIVLHRGKSKSW